MPEKSCRCDEIEQTKHVFKNQDFFLNQIHLGLQCFLQMFISPHSANFRGFFSHAVVWPHPNSSFNSPTLDKTSRRAIWVFSAI